MYVYCEITLSRFSSSFPDHFTQFKFKMYFNAFRDTVLVLIRALASTSKYAQLPCRIAKASMSFTNSIPQCSKI